MSSETCNLPSCDSFLVQKVKNFVLFAKKNIKQYCTDSTRFDSLIELADQSDYAAVKFYIMTYIIPYRKDLDDCLLHFKRDNDIEVAMPDEVEDLTKRYLKCFACVCSGDDP